LLFATTIRLNLQQFFKVTSILLIFFAAGLVAYGVHELIEAGWIPAGIEHVWDINPIIDEKSTLGLILKALFGYNGNPALVEVIAYVSYLVVVTLALWMRSTSLKASQREDSLTLKNVFIGDKQGKLHRFQIGSISKIEPIC